MKTVPTWDQYMAPSLRVLSDGEVHRTRPIVEAAADILGVTEEQREILIPSGQEQWVNRGNWALSYLARAGAAERPSRGRYRITDVGRKLLAAHPGGITERDLRALAGDPNAPHTWKAFPNPATQAEVVGGEETSLDPTEQVERGIARIHANVASELLERLHAQEPAFFEQAVLDLLIAMGYGGADGKATRTQLSGDGGIDGIVDQDALGLSRISCTGEAVRARLLSGPTRDPSLRGSPARQPSQSRRIHHLRPLQHRCARLRRFSSHAGRAHRRRAAGITDDSIRSRSPGAAHRTYSRDRRRLLRVIP